MKKQMHLAAQYLAAAGISFLNKKEDDSHTNLGFSISDGSLKTHLLSKQGDQLLLNYKAFSLQWVSSKEALSLSLDGKSHKEVLQWLTEVSKKALNKEYTYSFHYSLPYEITNAYVFKLESTSALQKLIALRTLAQLSLKEVNKTYNLEADIRVWPHHFDTGIYSSLSNSDIAIGLGLAIPDNVCSEHYLYASGYKHNKSIDTSSFSNLKKGEWKNKDFKGAVLPALNIDKLDAIGFFSDAIQEFK